MSSGTPHLTVDELLDGFIAAWHAGQAPSVRDLLALAAPEDREELTQLIAGFVELAPTVPPTDEAVAAAADDPLLQRIAALEDDWWEQAQAGAASHAGIAAESHTDWGARLAALRAQAGRSLAELADAFSSRFGLSPADGARAATVLGELERGALPSTGVAARAARALEELLGAPAGALRDGAAPALGAPVLRGELPEVGDERDQLVDLLRTVDDAVTNVSPDSSPADSLEDLLGG